MGIDRVKDDVEGRLYQESSQIVNTQNRLKDQLNSVYNIFSCEGAALEVLMYVCPSVCLQVEIFSHTTTTTTTVSYTHLTLPTIYSV